MSVRTDPTDNGGMFVGRRPGTAPVRYRDLPEEGSRGRRSVDRMLARILLGVMVVLNLCFWGPIPVGGLWIASQVQYLSGDVSTGIAAGFMAIIGALILGLAVLVRLDHAWVLVRRAAGYDQRTGVLPVVFGMTAALGASAFAFWLIVLAGPGSGLMPAQGG